MKRNRDKVTPKSASATGDIKQDLSAAQLAAIGAAALAFNEVELALDEIFYGMIGIADEMQLQISTRLNIEARVDIIKLGIQNSGLQPDDLQELLTAIGENCFVKLKSIRNSIIHARVVNASIGIGMMVDKSAKVREVLLNVPALELFYRHLIALRNELISANTFLWGEKALHYFAQHFGPDDPNKARLEADRPKWTVPFHNHRDARLSLPPLPEFPSESEVREAEARWSLERQADVAEKLGPLPDYLKNSGLPRLADRATEGMDD
jgi:hypothetical protein